MADESKLESVFGRVNLDRLWLCRTVKAVDGLAFDAGQVDWLIESLDDTVVPAIIPSEYIAATCFRWIGLPLRQRVFDVIQSRVDQDTTVVPCSRLDPDSLVDKTALSKHLVGNHDS